MAGSIQEMFNNFKRFLQEDSFFYTALIVLVAITAFGLGQWSVVDSVNNKQLQHKISGVSISTSTQGARLIDIESKKNSVMPQSNAENSVAVYVGSKNGSKYHLPECPGAQQIKDENKVFFNSKDDAVKAGYSPASNCKGI